MGYFIEVQVNEPDPTNGNVKKVWVRARPTVGAPYQYNTRDEAERICRMCYPEWLAVARVVFEPDANIKPNNLPSQVTKLRG